MAAVWHHLNNNAAQQSHRTIFFKHRDDYRPRRFPSRPVFMRIGLLEPDDDDAAKVLTILIL